VLKVSEYEKHAAECRDMARRSKDPTQKAQLEEMARAWDILAQERSRNVGKNRPLNKNKVER
jgi:hypothetical protein